jgi:hypothetical protein
MKRIKQALAVVVIVGVAVLEWGPIKDFLVPRTPWTIVTDGSGTYSFVSWYRGVDNQRFTNREDAVKAMLDKKAWSDAFDAEQKALKRWTVAP